MNGIPASATAVALNITGTNATKATYVSVYPTGGTHPNASTLNLDSAGVGGGIATEANFDIVQVGLGGSITVYNGGGSVDTVVDLTGYYVSQPILSLSPANLNLASPIFPALDPPQLVTATNLGASPLTIFSVTPTTNGLPGPGSFSLAVPGFDRCTGTTLQPGQSCLVAVVYQPVVLPGTFTGTLTFQSNAQSSTEQVSLVASIPNP